jgi:hypothetical protein
MKTLIFLIIFDMSVPYNWGAATLIATQTECQFRAAEVNKYNKDLFAKCIEVTN